MIRNKQLDLSQATLSSPTLTGTATAPTPVQTSNDTTIATTAFVKTAISNLVNGAPDALDTLKELSSALGDDANFASTMTTALAGKANSSHSHGASDITSGTLGIARGGTGATTFTSNAVLTGNGTSAIKAVATANGACYATATNGAPTFGTLPVAQGGTGQTNLSNVTVGAATKATQDGSGNTITSTYLPLSGGTITGNVRLKNSTNYGVKLNFGDGDYVYLYEPEDDILEIKAKKIRFVTSDTSSGDRVTYNGVPIMCIGSANAPTATTNAIWFDTSNQVIKYYNGSSWVIFGAAYK